MIATLLQYAANMLLASGIIMILNINGTGRVAIAVRKLFRIPPRINDKVIGKCKQCQDDGEQFYEGYVTKVTKEEDNSLSYEIKGSILIVKPDGQRFKHETNRLLLDMDEIQYA